MNDLAMALHEMNGSSSDNNKLQIEHLFLLGSTKSVDKAVKRLTDGLLDFGRCVSECLQLVSVGAAICLVLVGTSSVIRALRRDDTMATTTTKTKTKKSKQEKRDKKESKAKNVSGVDELTDDDDDAITTATSFEV